MPVGSDGVFDVACALLQLAQLQEAFGRGLCGKSSGKLFDLFVGERSGEACKGSRIFLGVKVQRLQIILP
jgi:hypothetical protein